MSLSLLTRAVVAIALLIGFYLLALGIASGLGYVVYLLIVTRQFRAGKVMVLAAAGALAILWSIIPRPDRFVAPGPELGSSQHPKLLSLIESVAKDTRQAMPVQIFLVPDVNAWVAQRGGIMGIGSRRVMGLGLPALQALTTDQLRAVLAHEFGHYHGGDTKLGPLLYKTRSAIGRTLSNMAEVSSALNEPFLWYGKLFLRITHATSRAQELAADALAARLYGGSSLASGLQAIHRAAVAYPVFWNSELVPLLEQGRRPPWGDGFARFMGAQGVKDQLATDLTRTMESTEKNPYDTHPPLPERLVALGSFESAPDDSPLAIHLLNDVPKMEAALLSHMFGADVAGTLRSTRWEDVGTDVLIPGWRKSVSLASEELLGKTVSQLPELMKTRTAFGRAVAARRKQEILAEVADRLAAEACASAIALAALRRGFVLHCDPGEQVLLVNEGRSFDPYRVILSLAEQPVDEARYQEWCRAMGASDWPLLEAGDLPEAGKDAGPQAAS